MLTHPYKGYGGVTRKFKFRFIIQQNIRILFIDEPKTAP